MEGGTLGEAAKSGSLTEDHVAFTGGEVRSPRECGEILISSDFKSLEVSPFKGLRASRPEKCECHDECERRSQA